MKVIIAGGRHYNDYQTLKEICTKILINCGSVDIEIVSGAAQGADSLGEQFAKEMGYKIKQFPADWNKHGKAAGPIRNSEMAKYSDVLIVFWDSKSKGTKHMIDVAKKNELQVRVYKY